MLYEECIVLLRMHSYSKNHYSAFQFTEPEEFAEAQNDDSMSFGAWSNKVGSEDAGDEDMSFGTAHLRHLRKTNLLLTKCFGDVNNRMLWADKPMNLSEA